MSETTTIYSGKTGTDLSIDFNDLYKNKYGVDAAHIKYYSFSFKERPFINDIIDILTPIFKKYNIDHYNSESTSVKSNYYDDDDVVQQKNKININKLYLKSLYFPYTDDSNTTYGIGISIKSQDMVFLYIMSSSIYSEFENDLVNHVTSSFKKLIGKEEATICFICDDNSSLYLKSIAIKSNPKKYNLNELYNDDFIKTSEHIVKSLKKENNNGIVLLHGLPGTGKTSYLRYLISQISTKRIIYVPPDLMHRIGTPDFFRFLLDYKNSILVLEDSENIIKIREGGESAAVANLLNLTDGIMGDALSFQVVCTFNAKINVIDPALMRSGRMIANYEFKELSLDKTKNLISKINNNIDLDKITKGDTLANIFNYKKDSFTLINESTEENIDNFTGIKLI